MTTDEAGQLLAYDAWGRIFTVNTDGTGSAEITYAYDALFRRIKETVSGTTIDLYHSPQWQVVEERSGSTTKAQNIWSAVYVDALVLRDRDANNTGGDGIGDGGLEQRLYVLQDANFNVTALVDTSGVVQERYIYDPYGTRSVLDANWSADADGISDYAFNWGHQGGRHDLTAGLVHFRFRELDTSLGRWTRQDPAGPVDGANLQQALTSDPITHVDPLGLLTSGGGGNEEENRQQRRRRRRNPFIRCIGGIAGRVWNLPNTCVGVVAGVAGIPGGARPRWRNGILEFENHPFAGTAITLGEVVLYDDKYAPTSKYGPTETLRDHERKHVSQGRVLGPFYLPVHGVSKLHGVIRDGDFHGPGDFMEPPPK